jgi:hypothetical protein
LREEFAAAVDQSEVEVEFETFPFGMIVLNRKRQLQEVERDEGGNCRTDKRVSMNKLFMFKIRNEPH